ncbi:MAG: HRDC domain-containing protein, partial [Cephaloticoccus sp.]
GRDLLRSRAKLTLTKPMDLPTARRVTKRSGDIACDEILFARLRGLRKQLADERKVPAYVIFGDATLRAMARAYPAQLADMAGIFGMGEKKLAEYGPAFAAAIAEFLETNPQQSFD